VESFFFLCLVAVGMLSAIAVGLFDTNACEAIPVAALLIDA
jgi:hypothetical protein